MKRLIALLVGAVALFGCLAEPHPDDTGTLRVVEFSDSLGAMSHDATEAHYIDDPLWYASLNTLSGTQIDTPAHVGNYQFVQLGDVVVLALGTNDIGCVVEYDPSMCGASDTLGSVKQDLRDAVVTLTQHGAARVVVPNVNTYSASIFHGGVRLPITQDWNAWLLQAEASTHPDWAALDVVDWDSIARDHPDWIGSDQIHHTPAGIDAYATVLYNARLPEVP